MELKTIQQALIKEINKGRGMQFLESYFEIIAVGLYFNIDDYEDTEADIKWIKQKIETFSEQIEYKNIKAGIIKRLKSHLSEQVLHYFMLIGKDL